MKWHAHNIEQMVGGLLAGCAVIWSFAHILRHLRWNRTKLWRCTARILVVVPIYALSAWGCLMLEDSERGWAELFTLTREGYEAVAIVSFLQFMLTFLKGPKQLAMALIEKGQAPFQHPWPLRLVLQEYRPGPHFVASVVIGIMQYIPTMFIIFLLNLSIWRFGEMDCCKHWLHRLALAPKLAKAASCAFAMYNLWVFYHVTHMHLEHTRPMLKFLGIKGIVFFTFWQELAIAFMVKLQIVPNYHGSRDKHLWSQHQIADGIKNMLLCIEMLAFSELHRRAYPYDEFESHGGYEIVRSPKGDNTEIKTFGVKSEALDREDLPSVTCRAFRIPHPFDLIELWSEVVELRFGCWRPGRGCGQLSVPPAVEAGEHGGEENGEAEGTDPMPPPHRGQGLELQPL